MADTVDTAASSSPADEAEKPPNAVSTDEAEKLQDAAPADQAQEARHTAPADEAEQPQDTAAMDEAEQPQASAPADEDEKPHEAAPADEAEEPHEAAPADEDEKPQDTAAAHEDEESHEAAPADEAEEPERARSVTELFEQLGRDLTDLAMSETQLEAARNLPEVRRAAREIVGALVVVVAALTAFAFLNVGAVLELSKVVATWLAALMLAAFWIVVAGVLLFGVMGRARRWLLWIVLKSPPSGAIEDLKRERDDAGRAARGTLERLGPALATQIALAAIPKAGEVAGEVAGDVAGGVIEIGDTVLEASDETVEAIAEQLPGGGLVNQVWDVALVPGRFGIRVATTVLRRGKPADSAVKDS